MSPEEQQNEMSMEDILSSIKDILENDAPEDASDKPAPAASEDSTPTTPIEENSVNAEPEDDVFDLSKAMIVEDAADESDSKVELDEIGPDFDITPKDDDPLLSPDDIELPDFQNEDSDNIGLSDSALAETPVQEQTQETSVEEDFSFNIDDLLQSASDAIAEDSDVSVAAAEESNEPVVKDDVVPDLPDIDVTSEPIFEQENENLPDPVFDEKSDIENLIASKEEDELSLHVEEEQYHPQEPEAAPADFIEETTVASEDPINEIPAAVDEDPQEIPDAEFSEVDEVSTSEPTVVEEPVSEISTEAVKPEEKEDAADVSAGIINNFAKMFAEQSQEHFEKPVEPKTEIPATVSGMGNANKTIEQVVEGVIQGIVASSVNAEMTKNVDIVAYAQKEIHAQTKAWLEANLPAIVEAAVQKEIERVMAKVGK